MKDLKGCFSHKTDDWRTPFDLYLAFKNRGYLDPCLCFFGCPYSFY